jgi:hypothetical protein
MDDQTHSIGDAFDACADAFGHLPDRRPNGDRFEEFIGNELANRLPLSAFRHRVQLALEIAAARIGRRNTIRKNY